MSENDQQNLCQFKKMIIPQLQQQNRDSTSPPKAQVDNASLQQAMDKNKESLKVKLMTRRTINQLVEQGILPSLKVTPHFYHQRQKLERAKTGDFLKNKIQRRPDRQELIQQHILEDTTVDPSLHDKQRQLKKARLADDLNDRLSHRPGPLELVKGNILQADEKFAQAVKEGQIPFKRTCEGQSLRHPPPSFVVEEDSGSDVALSPPQDNADQSFNNLPSVDSMVSSPYSSIDSPSSYSDSKSFLQSPVNCTPSSQSSNTSQNEVVHSVPTARVRKKSKPKSQPKPRTIKFHEYKGPPSAKKDQASTPSSETSYELLLKQQQLFLQWQLEWQQKYPQMILPVTQKPKGDQNSNNSSVKDNTQEASAAPQKCWSKLEDLKVSDLKAELKKRNLPVSGSKPQLIERLKPYSEFTINIENKVQVPTGVLNTNTVIASEPAACPISVSGIILDKLPTLAPQSEPITSVVAMDTTMNSSSVTLSDDGSLVVYNTVPVHAPLMVSRPSSVAPMDIETHSPSASDSLENSVNGNSSIAVNENIVKLQQRKIQELQLQLQKSQMQLQQQQWLQQQAQQQALLASQPVPIAPAATVNQLHQMPVTSIAHNALPQVNGIDTKALQKLQQHLQQKFQQQQLLQQLQQNNGNTIFPPGSSTVSAAVKANLAAFIHNQQNANARVATLNQQPVPQLSGLQPIMLCQSNPYTNEKPRANSLPNGITQPRTSSLPNFSAVLKAKPIDVYNAKFIAKLPADGNEAPKQPPKIKQESRSQNSCNSGKQRSSRKSVKSQAVDDVLEILIKNGELPPSAAQVPSTPTTPENQKSNNVPPAFPANSGVMDQDMPTNSLPSSVLHEGNTVSLLDFDFQLDQEAMDLGVMDTHPNVDAQSQLMKDSESSTDQLMQQQNDISSSKAMDMEFSDWLDVLSSSLTNQSSSSSANQQQPLYNCAADPLMPNMANGSDTFDMFSLDDMDFKTAPDMNPLSWDKVDFAT